MVMNAIAIAIGSSSGAGIRSLPSGSLVGTWFADTFTSSPTPTIPNGQSAVPVASNLFRSPRRMFSNADWWTPNQISAITDDAATAPDGTNDASTVVTNAANWVLHPTFTTAVPAGTYTLACSVKRNTGSDQSFAFTKDNTSTRSAVQTATSAWQRFSYTFTLGSPAAAQVISLCSSDGVTAANLQICDFELFAGSSDLGPETYGGHLYLGNTAYDTKPSYASGALDLSTGGYGLIQFATNTSVSTFTAIALVSKIAAGSAYHGFLSRVQLYTQFTAAVEVSTQPTTPTVAFFNGAAGLWNLLNVGYHTIALRYDGTTQSLWLDDILLFQLTGSISAFNLRDLFCGVVNSLGLTCGEKISGIAMYNRALSDLEVRQASAAMFGRADPFGIFPAASTRILCAEGDSITASASPTSYAYIFGPNASPAVLGNNNAVSGSTLATLTSRATVDDAILPKSKKGRKFILSVLIGTNDLVGYSGGPTQYAADVATYCLARKAAGWDKVVLCTVLPSTVGGFNTARNALNAIYTGVGWAAANGVDAICDFAADPTMGPDAAASNASLYSDGTHPTLLGQQTLEPVYRAVINAL